jgi:hypothetical protein
MSKPNCSTISYVGIFVNIKWLIYIILSSHLRVKHLNDLSRSGFEAKFFKCLMRFIRPLQLIFLAFSIVTILREKCEPWKSSQCKYFQPPVTLSSIGPNVHFGTMFCKALNLHSFLRVRKSEGSSVGYWLDDRAIEVCSQAEAKVFSCSLFWGPPSLLYNG